MSHRVDRGCSVISAAPIVLGLLPAVFAAYCVYKNQILAAICAGVELFAIVLGVPRFRMRENQWMFLFGTLYCLPFNIRIVLMIIEEEVLDYEGAILQTLIYIVLFSVLFSVESVVFGIIVRLIRPRQYRLLPREESEESNE